MDPKLAERFRKQQEKEERGEELEVAEIGSAANKEKQLDPKLAARWAKQKQLEENGENVQVAEIGSACKASRDLDPKLAAAWAKQADQQEEAVEAAVKAMDELGSAAVVERALDPALAKRWTKIEAGDTPVREIGSAAETSATVNAELAQRWAKQQEALEAAANEGGAQDAGPGAVAAWTGTAREHLSIRPGYTCDHVVAWPSEPPASRVHWSAVVLDGLNIDLEVTARLRPAAPGAPAAGADAVVLQRHARGETFVADFCPGNDRRCLASPVGGGSAARRHLEGQETPKREFRDVEKLIFKFSNAYSWLTAKEVELVLLFE